MEEEKRRNWHDKYYKLFLIIPALLLVFSLYVIYNFYQENGDIINKDISLTGGTSVTVNSDVELNDLKTYLTENGVDDFSVRGISDLRTGKQLAFMVETRLSPNEITPILEKYLGFELDSENSSVEFTGESLSAGFYKQLRIALIIALVLMSFVVFLIFRNFVPSLAVILAAITDIIMTLAVVDLLGWKISNAGIVAILMLIGYSVDSDILLTTRTLKTNKGSINSRLYGSFKTGITMTLTSMAAVSAALFVIYSFSEVLTQIFSIVLIGLGFDLINTYITNVGILKWYMEKRRMD